MRRHENRDRDVDGISMPAAVVLIALISMVTTSSVVIMVVDRSDNTVDDEILDPFFHMKAEPLHQNASVMETVKYRIWFETEIYLYTPIQLKVMDMYDGVLSFLYPEVIYPGENATLELTALFEGEFFREVIGTYDGLKDRVTVRLSVMNGSEEDDLQMNAYPDERTAFPYQWVYYSITVDVDGDLGGLVYLSVEEMYDCCMTSLHPRAIYPGQTAVLGLCGMIPGEFTRNVTGTCGGMSASVEVELHVMMHTDEYL